MLFRFLPRRWLRAFARFNLAFVSRSRGVDLRRLVLLVGVSCLSQTATAQWVTESYPLEAGYNAIWLTIDCSDRSIDTLLAGNTAIFEVWQWNANASSTSFTASPTAPAQADSQWKVWKRGIPVESTLSSLTPNAAYIVRVNAATTLQLKGQPVAPSYNWKSSGVNFVGFPTVGSSAPTFTNFLSNSEILSQAPPVFYYDGGPITQNPRRLVAPNSQAVERGEAYWVQTTDYTDFYGPLKVSSLSGSGLRYGSKLNSGTIRLENNTGVANNQTVTATVSLVASDAAPGQGSAAALVQVRVRGPLDGNLQYTYTSLPTTITLAPGEQVDLLLDADRSQMTTPGQAYEGILQITDSLSHTQIDLPVSAVGTTKTGVWVGVAVIDAVNRVETISGPEFDAPLGSPDGKGPETTTSVVTTSTTVSGVTTDNVVFDADFDSDYVVYLDAVGIMNNDLVVTDLSGNTTYVVDTDYTLESSNRATVTDGGSGYTTAPTVTISGGGGTGATATATLSAAVSSVAMTSGGSGYSGAPTVTITGDGSGASAIAVTNGDLVTDILITNGGFGYSSPPTIVISGGSGSGATAVASIVGSVGSVNIVDGGLGYIGIPQVTFESADGNGSGASAAVTVSGESVMGVDAVTKIVDISLGGSGYTSAPVVNFTGGGGTAAAATAVLSASVVGLTISDGGSGYTSAPTVTIVGDGAGAEATASIAGDAITGVTLTDGGSGYSTAPTVTFSGGAGTGATADASIAGSVNSILVDDGGVNYTSAPQVSFTSADGNGSGAVATAEISGASISNVTISEVVEFDSIGSTARFSMTTSSPAPEGASDGSVVTTVTSTSQLITLNGKSHVSTKRISTGGAAAAPSNFPIRLILHSPPSATPATLLQQVYLGERDGFAYAGTDEDVMASIVSSPGATPEGVLARLSSASFPRGESWPGTGAFGGAVSFTVTLGYDAESNPFVHTYHPDHDNWDARYESKLDPGIESFQVTRDITLTFNPLAPSGFSGLTWGVTTLGGTYTEVINGLRSQEIGISGSFILEQVSEVPALTTSNP